MRQLELPIKPRKSLIERLPAVPYYSGRDCVAVDLRPPPCAALRHPLLLKTPLYMPAFGLFTGATISAIRHVANLLCFVCVWLGAITHGACTGLEISNVSQTNWNSGAGTFDVRFDITWKDSWRVKDGPVNWDAAWVFVKFRKNGGAWQHASLNDTGHSVPTGFEVIRGLADESLAFNSSSNPAVGVFIYRAASGSNQYGTVSLTDVAVRWNYAQDGVIVGDSIELEVHGIEMVYITQGAFYAGDSNATSSLQQGPSDTDPWHITSEGPISTTNDGSNNYYYPGEGDSAGSVFTIPASYPKGFNAFYMMKYEVNQEEYLHFSIHLQPAHLRAIETSPTLAVKTVTA